MPKNELDGLPIIDDDETEKITAAVRADDIYEGDPKKPERHPIAIALRRQPGVDDARVTKSETLIRREPFAESVALKRRTVASAPRCASHSRCIRMTLSRISSLRAL